MRDSFGMRTVPLNPKELPVGSVAYFVDKYRGRDLAGNVRWNVDFGIVEEHYPSVICLTKLEPADRRLINGIPYKDFKTPTPWQKLPKGWTYDTRLFEERTDYSAADVRSLNVSDPSEILAAYQDGRLVRTWDADHSTIREQWGESDPERRRGEYRLVRDYDSARYVPPYESINWREVYKTYAEAEAVVSAHEAELRRVASLSDYDWSVEQIDNVLARWAKGKPERGGMCEKYREWLLALDNVEDIEVRVFSDTVQWKPLKRKRWANIVL